jgi:Lamin Tail Domain/CotH kinase protein/Concanavalin A-like lectin/glucanases superfamily/Bacterial Ig domain
MKFLRLLLSVFVIVASVRADILVNLDSTSLPTGQLLNWTNTGTLGGNFAKGGSLTPSVTNVSIGAPNTVRAVSLTALAYYVGPVAPASLTGSTSPRSIEAWVMNPSLVGEETVVAWGRRGGLAGNNSALTYGSSLGFGAVNHTGAVTASITHDMGWNSSGAASPAANTWHFLVYTWDGTTCRLYVDGFLTNSRAIALDTLATSTVASGSLPLKVIVGAQNEPAGTQLATAGYTASMHMARIRVRNELLTPAQITAAYFSEGPTFGRGQPTINSFTSNATTSLPPGTPVALTWNVAGADTVSINNGAPAISGPTGTVVVNPAATTTYTLTATNGNGNATRGVTVTIAPYVAPLKNRYSFSEGSGTTVNDSVGGLNGSIIGAGWSRDTAQVILPGGASGTAPYIDLPNNVMTGLTNVTFEGWITINGSQNWSRLFDFGTGTAGELNAPGGSASGNGYAIISAQIGGDLNNQRTSLKADGQGEQMADSTFVTPIGTQTHFAYVYSATGNNGTPQVKYYRNGALTATLNTSYLLSQITWVNNWLGRSNFTGDNNTNGSYNEFRIWSNALSASDIAANVAAGPDTVPDGPPINAFFAIPSTIYDGETTTLYWGVSNQQEPLTATITPEPGAVAGTSGSVTVAPPGIGAVTYTYTGTNPLGTRNASAIVTVLSGAPVATGASLSIYQDTSTPVTLAATDPNTPVGSLTYNYTNPAAGTLSGTAPNLTYTPPPGFVGEVAFTFTASDATRSSNSANILINVLNAKPIAQNGSASTPYETAVPVTLVATDPNTPVGSLSYATSNPVHGTLTGTAPNLTYTPAPGYHGADSFQFTANDGTYTSNVATVSLTVIPPPLPPTDIVPSSGTILTDIVSGKFVARLRPVDPNAGDSFALALVAGAGDTHNGFFTLAGNQLISSHNFSSDLGQVVSVRVRVTDALGQPFEKVLTFTVTTPVTHVKINEINYNSARNTQLSEFIELYNPTGADVDLGGWRFNSGVNFVFPAGTIITNGGYLVIAKAPAVIQSLYGIAALGPWDGGLDSQGEEIVLRDSLGSKVDGVDYGITSPWPATPNGDGPTLELASPSLDNDQGGNWRASSVAPTVVSYVSAGSAGWSYRKGTSEASSPVAAWRFGGFTLDGTWLTGTAPIGVFKVNSNTATASNAETGVTLATQLTDMATYTGTFVTSYTSVAFRKTFTAGASVPKQLLLRVMHNDAAIVWINGVEVARFGFPSNAPSDPAFNSGAYYERGNDPWSELVITNADLVVQPGSNVIAIQGWAKPPLIRTSGQDDPGLYNVFDFSIDAELKNAPEMLGTPGAQNSTFAANSPPAVRNINHSPDSPLSTQPILVTARIDDPDGVGPVTVSYQLCAPGAFIPSTLPFTAAQLTANPFAVLAANPAFELPANWTTIPMVDDGSIDEDIAGDGIYTARIPAQPHRTLVRYRINAADLTAQSVRLPAADDPRKNFAAFVYNGVPAYGAHTPATLNTLPAYHWITRPADFTALLAYAGGDQIANNNGLYNLLARKYENWEGALVVGDQVIDHTLIRLRGGNSRYMGAGKRHFRFKFPKGTPLQAEDNDGDNYPRKWEEMLFNKLFGNKGYYDWGIPYAVGAKMWELVGVPTPQNHYVHFRVVRDASETHATLGDFWGLYQALELPEGKNFLAARDLPSGNFYKMSDFIQNGEMSERYQAAGSVDFGEDYDNVRYNIHQTTPQSEFEKYVNMPSYYRYNAIQEAIRHYDIFIEPTGRHRMKNLIWWFEPQTGNELGRCLFMPYDWDASFGPNWNSGFDVVQNAIYNYADITDSPTWQLPKQNRLPMQIARRNAIRDLRDLMLYRDGSGRGPFDDIIDDEVAPLAAFWPADRARWPATGAAADNAGGVPFKVADMKGFIFTGWTDTVGGDPAIGSGGRVAYLDSISDGFDAGQLPGKPTITNASAAGNPVDGIALTSSPFSDPQGVGTFGAMQWRIGEITDPTAPAYDATAPRIYEITDVWTSGEIATFDANITVPPNALRVGHTYRARVRHRDNTGRYGHWSDPVTFTATTSNYVQVLRDNLMITELMYHPAPPTAAEAVNGWLEEDFEYAEVTNVSEALTLDLSNVRSRRVWTSTSSAAPSRASRPAHARSS